MPSVSLDITGGEKLEARLEEISRKLSRAATVKVGFLEKATYPADAKRRRKGGLKVAQVAFWNEFGTSRAPPRPFFRQMIAAKSPKWGNAMAAAAKASDYDAKKTLTIVGTGIKDQLVSSIVSFASPPNAASTIRRKGFDAPLRDTMLMTRSADFEVD